MFVIRIVLYIMLIEKLSLAGSMEVAQKLIGYDFYQFTVDTVFRAMFACSSHGTEIIQRIYLLLPEHTAALTIPNFKEILSLHILQEMRHSEGVTPIGGLVYMRQHILWIIWKYFSSSLKNEVKITKKQGYRKRKVR